MKPPANPWVDRYRILDDTETIKRLSRVRAEVLADLDKLPVAVAADRMRRAFQSTFYPTSRACEIIREIIQAALSHAMAYYPDGRTLLTRAYLEKMDIEPYLPILLTGPAGVGKTQIRKAIGRLLSEEVVVNLGAECGQLPLVASRTITARTRNSLAELLRPLARPEVADGTVKCSLARLPQDCAAWLYLCGVCLFMVDELQFLTTSKSANTLISQALLAFSFVRTPFMVVANYSLGHKLRRRPPEERQRLLGHVIVLLPDGADSKDWLGVIEEYERAAQGVFDFKFGDQAQPLWRLSAGGKRELVLLLVLAYSQMRGEGRTRVTWMDVERAYVHADFSDYRTDIEAMIMHGVGSQELKEVLRCPFPVPLSTAQEYDRNLKSVRTAKVAAAALDDSMSQSERKARAFVEGQLNPKSELAAKDASIGRPKANRAPRTVASMREVGERFRKQIGTGG